jgi:hypothetical protein
MTNSVGHPVTRVARVATASKVAIAKAHEEDHRDRRKSHFIRADMFSTRRT